MSEQKLYSANASEHAGVSARRAVRAGGRHAWRVAHTCSDWAGSARRCRGGCSPAYTAVSGLDRAEGTACCSSNALAWILGRENFLAAEVKFRNELMHLKSSQKSASEGTTVNTGELKGLHTPRGADFRAESRWRAARARVQHSGFSTETLLWGVKKGCWTSREVHANAVGGKGGKRGGLGLGLEQTEPHRRAVRRARHCAIGSKHYVEPHLLAHNVVPGTPTHTSCHPEVE